MTRKWFYSLLLLGVFALIGWLPTTALAQNAISFDLDLAIPAQPVLTWSTTPAGAVCTGSGDWAGDKGSAGQEIVAPIRGNVAYVLECAWPADSIATLSWVNPTTNTDGSAYTNPGATRLAWSPNGDVGLFDCLSPDAAPGISWTDRPPDNTMHTVTGLGPTGTWEFAAYAVNALGLCSSVSNTAVKMFSGALTVTDSISVTVPGAVSGLGAT